MADRTHGRPTERVIDLNADLGESYGRWRLGDDDAMLRHVSSANLACGFHAGDPPTLRRALRLAVAAGVAVGAHPGYPDLRGFGRRPLSLPPDEVEADVVYQVGALQALARAEGGRVRYVKPHGALYHAMSSDQQTARAVFTAVAAAGPGLPVLVAAGSDAAAFARDAGAPHALEAFVDRGYLGDGSLVPRGEPGDLVDDPAAAAQRALALAIDGVVHTIDGRALELHPHSLCLHGDGPSAVASSAAVRAALREAGVRVRPFVDA